jgi:isopenicillin N synthase-like dioxygenase
MASSDEFDLPVIDLAALHWKSKAESDQQLMRSEELKKLRDACQEFGFFHVINHGINPTLIRTVDSIARDMFALPTDIKEKAILPTFFTGYIPPEIGPMGKESVPESMIFSNDHIVDQVSSKLWPQGNQKFWYAFAMLIFILKRIM